MISLTAPTNENRTLLIEHLLSQLSIPIDQFAGGLCESTPGYNTRDIVRVVDSLSLALDRPVAASVNSNVLLREAVESVNPSPLHGVDVLAPSKGQVLSWSSFVGYEQVKDRIKTLLLNPWTHPEQYRRCALLSVEFHHSTFTQDEHSLTSWHGVPWALWVRQDPSRKGDRG